MARAFRLLGAGVLFLASVGLGAPGVARAGNDEGVPVGNQAAMTGAVVATIGDGSALWYNPAGLGRVQTGTADITATAVGLRLYNSPDLVQVVGGAPVSQSVVEILSIPSALSYVRPLGNDLHIGLGLFSPRASDLVLRSDLDGEIMGVTGELGLAIVDTESRYVGVLGLGWSPSPRLRFGIALRGGYSSTFATTQFFLRRRDATSDAVVALAATASAKLGDVGGSVGVQWDPIDELSFGLSFESPTLAFVGFAQSTSFAVAASRTAVESMLDAAVDDTGSLDPSADALDPARFRFGTALTLPGWRLAVDVDVALPLSSPNLNIDRALLVNARLGGAIALADGLELGLGAFTDLNPARSVGGVREGADFVGGSVAIHTEHHLALAEEEESDEIVLSTYIAFRYAYGFGDLTGLRFDPAGDTALATVPSALEVHELMLHFGSSVSF